MTGTRPLPTLCSAVAIAFDGDAVPDWIHLLPNGDAHSVDGRGPYRVADAAALMAASLRQGDKLVLDVNHATDIKGPLGEEAPARGWIVALQNRADGIWGQVEWTGEGRQIMADKQYRGVSPVIFHRKDGQITRIARASLTNTPNLIGMASLHAEQFHESEDTKMDWKKKLIELLKLDSEATDEAILAALGDKDKPAEGEAAMEEAVKVAMHSALAPIAKLAGVAETADAATVLAGVQALAKGDGGEVKSLQTQIAGLTVKIGTMESDSKRKDAEAFVDGAIRDRRIGVKPERDEYVAMHMENPARAEKLINAMPKMAPSTNGDERDDEDDDRYNDPTLLAADAAAYQRKLEADGQTISFANAVTAVKEGKHK